MNISGVGEMGVGEMGQIIGETGVGETGTPQVVDLETRIHVFIIWVVSANFPSFLLVTTSFTCGTFI